MPMNTLRRVIPCGGYAELFAHDSARRPFSLENPT
jgi:hypothetical protein